MVRRVGDRGAARVAHVVKTPEPVGIIIDDPYNPERWEQRGDPLTDLRTLAAELEREMRRRTLPPSPPVAHFRTESVLSRATAHGLLTLPATLESAHAPLNRAQRRGAERGLQAQAEMEVSHRSTVVPTFTRKKARRK
jgi:hypothetical protein